MQKKENNKKEINKQVVIIVASIIATVLCTIGVTLAAFVWNDESQKEQKIIVGDLNLIISSESIQLGSDLDVPVKDDEVDDLQPYEFTLKNTGKVDAYFKLKIADDTEAITKDSCTNNQIDKQYIGIKVTDGANITGLLSEYNDNSIDFGVLKPKEIKTYKLYLWLKSDVPNSVIGKHYHGKILLETEQTVDNERSLADAILNDNTIVEKAPDYSDTSTDKGLFKLQNDIALNDAGEIDKNIYFFRGL